MTDERGSPRFVSDRPPVSGETTLPERAVEALARYNHDLNNSHGWYDPECLRYPDDHREPYHRLYARAALTSVLAAGFSIEERRP